jgi:hypothetical protein
VGIDQSPKMPLKKGKSTIKGNGQQNERVVWPRSGAYKQKKQKTARGQHAQADEAAFMGRDYRGHLLCVSFFFAVSLRPGVRTNMRGFVCRATTRSHDPIDKSRCRHPLSEEHVRAARARVPFVFLCARTVPKSDTQRGERKRERREPATVHKRKGKIDPRRPRSTDTKRDKKRRQEK